MRVRRLSAWWVNENPYVGYNAARTAGSGPQRPRRFAGAPAADRARSRDPLPCSHPFSSPTIQTKLRNAEHLCPPRYDDTRRATRAYGAATAPRAPPRARRPSSPSGGRSRRVRHLSYRNVIGADLFHEPYTATGASAHAMGPRAAVCSHRGCWPGGADRMARARRGGLVATRAAATWAVLSPHIYGHGDGTVLVASYFPSTCREEGGGEAMRSSSASGAACGRRPHGIAAPVDARLATWTDYLIERRGPSIIPAPARTGSFTTITPARVRHRRCSLQPPSLAKHVGDLYRLHALSAKASTSITVAITP